MALSLIPSKRQLFRNVGEPLAYGIFKAYVLMKNVKEKAD
jgi:hypothetical protein